MTALENISEMLEGELGQELAQEGYRIRPHTQDEMRDGYVVLKQVADDYIRVGECYGPDEAREILELAASYEDSRRDQMENEPNIGSKGSDMIKEKSIRSDYAVDLER